jgi:hypothetical protein
LGEDLVTDAFRLIEEEKGRHFAELVEEYRQLFYGLFEAIDQVYLEHEREEIVESIPWAD